MCFNKEMDKMVVICGETPVKMKIFKFEKEFFLSSNIEKFSSCFIKVAKV
jgi:hypothetical protein